MIRLQKILNDFSREYIDKRYRVDWNTVKLDTGNSVSHEMMKARVCYSLQKQGIPFACEVRFKTGYVPDIICPTHIKKIIEVRYSETDKLTSKKVVRIPESLINEIIYVNAKDNFEERDIW